MYNFWLEQAGMLAKLEQMADRKDSNKLTYEAHLASITAIVISITHASTQFQPRKEQRNT